MEIIQRYRKSINPPYSPKDYITLALTFLFIFSIPITMYLVSQRQEQRGRAQEIQSVTTPVKKIIIAPSHIGHRLRFEYRQDLQKLVLKEKGLAGILPQPPQAPGDEKEYLNFQLRFTTGSKTYQNWISVRKDSLRSISDGKGFEFTVEIPSRERGQVSIEDMVKRNLFLTNL